MKTVEKDILGFKLPIPGVVENLKEAITAAGSEDAVVNDYNSNVLAHSHYAILRRAVVAKLEALTGIKRTGGTVKNEDGTSTTTPVEKDGVYVSRLESELGEETLQTHLAALQSLSSTMPVDYKPGVRGTGEGTKPAEKWLAYYDQLVKESKLDLFCSKYGIDTTQPEEELKIDVANKAREIVRARVHEAEKAAMVI